MTNVMTIRKAFESGALKSGQNVEYHPDINQFEMTETKSRGRLLKTEDYDWHVMACKNGRIYLIPRESRKISNIWLGGSDWRIGPEILNSICKRLYSDSRNELTARSLDIIAAKDLDLELILNTYWLADRYGLIRNHGMYAIGGEIRKLGFQGLIKPKYHLAGIFPVILVPGYTKIDVDTGKFV